MPSAQVLRHSASANQISECAQSCKSLIELRSIGHATRARTTYQPIIIMMHTHAVIELRIQSQSISGLYWQIFDCT